MNTNISTPARSSVYVDLRRGGRFRGEGGRGRELGELCVQRAEYLDQADRAVVEAIFRDGLTIKRLAALMHPMQPSSAAPAADSLTDQVRTQPRAPAAPAHRQLRSLSRRVRRLVERLTSPYFAFAIAHLVPRDQDERRRRGMPCWPPMRRRVAEACIIRGLSTRAAATALGVSQHVVRREMQTIRALFEFRCQAA